MVAIRKATIDDAAQLPAIERSAATVFLQVPSLSSTGEYDIQSVDRHCELIEQGTEWVAVEGEQLVGFLNAEADNSCLHIWEVNVLYELQGNGIGRKLVEAACDWARQVQLSAITLTTFRELPWNENFYRSMGFETLTCEQLSSSLAMVLARETEAGLLPEKRCAMVLRL